MASLVAPYAAKGAAAALGYMYLDARHGLSSDNLKGRALLFSTLGVKWANYKDRNSILYIFEDTARKQPNAVCYRCEGRDMTWQEVSDHSRRIAYYLLEQGFKPGDIIALLMHNKPAYPILWLAMLQINVLPAFLNYNLPPNGLLHCVKIAGARGLIFDSDLEDRTVDLVKPLSELGTRFFRWRDVFSLPREKEYFSCQTIDDTVLAKQSTNPVPHDYRKGLGWQDGAVLIYTSGTTGLPKAANCSHGRVAIAFRAYSIIEGMTKKDVIYTAMPLYHSTASFLAIGVAWRTGCTVAIGRKFSATKFWDDVRAADATVIQYVGEVPRYLLAAPPRPDDKDHRVRMAYGNGCKADIWEKFRERFGVRIISEFFASTEGTVALFNVNTGPYGAGAVGHEGTLASLVRRSDQALIRLDPITEEPYRNKQGWCERVATDEPGELCCKIDVNHALKAFRGYHGNEAATQKKIMTDVFAKGDAWFRMGDLIRKDADGHMYFSDRLGDTFRWRSENVSTTEVANVLGEVVDEANVYGVLVPQSEGRAGCAAIPADVALDLVKLSKHVTAKLPNYARPLFLRVVKQLETTSTNKQQKVTLRMEGIDPDLVKGDPMYWLQNGAYRPFTRADYAALKAGKARL